MSTNTNIKNYSEDIQNIEKLKKLPGGLQENIIEVRNNVNVIMLDRDELYKKMINEEYELKKMEDAGQMEVIDGVKIYHCTDPYIQNVIGSRNSDERLRLIFKYKHIFKIMAESNDGNNLIKAISLVPNEEKEKIIGILGSGGSACNRIREGGFIDRFVTMNNAEYKLRYTIENMEGKTLQSSEIEIRRYHMERILLHEIQHVKYSELQNEYEIQTNIGYNKLSEQEKLDVHIKISTKSEILCHIYNHFKDNLEEYNRGWSGIRDNLMKIGYQGKFFPKYSSIFESILDNLINETKILFNHAKGKIPTLKGIIAEITPKIIAYNDYKKILDISDFS